MATTTPTTPSAAPSSSSSPNPSTIKIATRKSALARQQAEIVASTIHQVYPTSTTSIIALDTVGDVDQTTPLHGFAGKALWTTELEALLADGRADMVVHSLKDMPTQLPLGLVLGAVTAREDARDALCVNTRLEAEGVRSLAALPPGSVVGTSSLRRSSLLKRRYPDLKFRDVRGNVPTRLKKLDDVAEGYAAIILAAAGLNRLGLGGRVTALLSWEEGGVMHAVGQGALGIEIREGDERMRRVCEGLGEERTWRATLAERSLMRTLEGGCSVPIGVETKWSDGEELLFRGIVVSLDGKQAVQAEMTRVITSREEADQFGWDMAQKLVEGGAGKVLEEINLNRKIVEQQGGA